MPLPQLPTQADLARRLPVTDSVLIHAPAEAVWKAISAPSNLEAAHPYVDTNPVREWPEAGESGVGAQDTLFYYSGLRMTRQIEGWYPPGEGETVGYDLHIWHRRSMVSRVEWRITSAGKGRSRLTITVWPYLLEHWPGPLRLLGQSLGIKPMMWYYLRSVVRGFKQVVETGQPVERNQFGPHPIFSPVAREAHVV